MSVARYWLTYSLFMRRCIVQALPQLSLVLPRPHPLAMHSGTFGRAADAVLEWRPSCISVLVPPSCTPHVFPQSPCQSALLPAIPKALPS